MPQEKVRFTREQLYELVWSKPMTDIAEEFGMSSVAFAKHCEKLDVPRPGRGHWQQLARPFEHEGRRYDLYFCLLRLHSIPIVDPDWPTVMARFGDGPEDFTDGIGLADRDPVLGEAKRRAIEQGYYDPKRPLSALMERSSKRWRA